MIYRRIFVLVLAYSLLLLPISAQRASLNQPIVEAFLSHPSAEITAPGTSSSLVISQFYGGGGLSGAVYNHDFVELFNRGAVSVQLNTWSVQYANPVKGNWINTPMPTFTLQPGQYFLIQLDTNGSAGAALPNPDYVAPVAQGQNFIANLGSTDGKLALTSSTATLPVNNCPSGSPIVDFVGWGSANCHEGATAVPSTSVSTGAKRAGGGCTDTDTNSTDFTVGTPVARNSSTPISACTNTTDPSGIGSSSLSNPNPNDPITLTVNVTPGSNPISTGIGVSADLSPIGGSSTQSFFDDATHGDAVAGDNIFSFATNAGTVGGVKTINFAVTDAQDRGSNGSFQFTVNAPSNPGGSGTASPNTVLPGASTTLTFNATQGTLPSAQITSVTANLSGIGGSASQAFTDSGDGLTFTFVATVANGTSTGFKSLPVTITDAQARTGSGTITLTVGSPVDPSHVPGEHELLGNPTGAGATDSNDWLIERNQYALSYNCSKGIPNWVGWHLDTSWIGSASRTDNYRNDTIPPLPNNCYLVQGNDYTGNVNNGGFDRGHDCPSGDRTDSTPDNDATFLMTNFIPQAPNNNQGIWDNMENYIRSQVTSGNEAYIWMGNAGQGGIGLNGFANTVANGHVVVPAYVWKVVMILPVGSSDLSRVDSNTRVFAVLTPNIQFASGLNSNWMTYICPVSKIEQLTGMNFFPNVPAATASVLKQKIDASISKQTIAGGSYTNLTVNFPETYLTGNVTITGNLALGPETLNTTDTTGNTSFTVTLAPGATVTRMNGGMVTGNLEKQYSASNQSFTYPVGTLNGYSPVTANLTALGANPSSLAVKAVQGVEPNVTTQSTALKRYWTLTETGDLTTNLVFNYLDADVPSGTPESSLVLDKYEGIFNQWPATIDTTTNTVTTTAPVSQFSDWTLLPNGNPTPTPTPTPTITPTPTPTPTPSVIGLSGGDGSVAEGDGHMDVTISRTGDTSGAASVDYATSDGSALQKSDYEIALGTVNFAPGETSKTFRVLIVDDNFVEGNETFGVRLSNATGTNTILGVDTATLTIIDNDVASTNVNPYDEARFFVRQHYLDFLNREPDQSGWDFWTNEITQCATDATCTQVKRINVSAAYFLSIEFQGTGYEAYLTHRSAFGPTVGASPAPVLYTTFMHDVQELGKGYVFGAPGADAVLEANKVAYFNEFVTRSAFLTKYPASLTNAQYVDNLLTTASLPTTGAFRDSLVNGLNGASKTRASVLREIAESSTMQTREFNRGFVTMEYFGYLRRDPETDGFNFWLKKLNDFNGNYIQAEMVKAFIESLEDRQRFGTP